MNLSTKYLIKILEQHGFIFKRSKGSHQLYYNPATNKTVIAPVHGGKDMKKECSKKKCMLSIARENWLEASVGRRSGTLRRTAAEFSFHQHATANRVRQVGDGAFLLAEQLVEEIEQHVLAQLFAEQPLEPEVGIGVDIFGRFQYFLCGRMFVQK
jgi:predicted RNA binding protein YcfA (HicA-like mRNA interferase family)